MSRIESVSKCLVERYGLARKDADSFVSEMFAVIRENLEKDRVVKVKGLGTFKLLDMNPRESVDVNTKERILIEGRAKVVFTPENAVRDRINSPFSQFETVDIDDDVDFSSIDDKYSDMEEPEDTAETVSDTEPLVAETQQVEPVVQSEPEPVVGHVEGEEQQQETVNLDGEPEQPVKEEETDQTAKEEEPEQAVGEEEPEQPVEVEEQEEPKLEASVSTVVHNPYCEDLIREGITHSRKIIRLLYVMLVLIVVVMLAGAVYFGYKLGVGVHEPKAVTPVKPVTKVVVMKPKPAVKKTIVAVGPADTVSQPVQNVDSLELIQAEYNKDVRVRTGAYRIVGLSKTVKMLPDQTFAGVCRAQLGEGMECYVEVFNGGKKDFKAGDDIKIPLLKLKKKMKRQ